MIVSDNMSYPDFVALMRQENTPPGGGKTVDEWVEQAKITCGSRVLDLACSTGFSSRRIAKSFAIDGVGIDISDMAISVAQEQFGESIHRGRLSFKVMDATNLSDMQGFTHTLGGCNFAFIQQRDLALDQVYKSMTYDGRLCTANFHYTTIPPEDLVDDVESVLGWRPNTAWDYDYWIGFFSRNFGLEYSRLVDLQALDECDLRELIERQFMTDELTSRYSKYELSAMKDRYLTIRSTLNEHRKYQGYSVQVWSKK